MGCGWKGAGVYIALVLCKTIDLFFDPDVASDEDWPAKRHKTQ